MHGSRRSVLMGYEDGGSDEDTGECWRLSSLSQPNTPHFCRSCMLGFRDRILLNNHLKQHYVENRGITTNNQDDKSVVKNGGDEQALFRCLNCKETFLSPEQLKVHCDSCQPDESSWQCYMCDQVLPDKIQLNAHFASAHGNTNMMGEGVRDVGVFCPHCRLIFDSKRDLKVHIEIDHELESPPKRPGRKPNDMYITVACECGKVFVNELDYQEHILEEHPGTEPLKWPKDMNDLKRKRRSDVGEYQTKRKKGGRYSSSAPSKTMNNSYYNDKQDGVGGSCVECGETFAVAVELKRHMQNDHIHLKPYSCSICARRFTRKSDVKRHIETIHGQAVSKEDMERIQVIRPFRCAKCGNPFGRYSDIKKHIEVHHGLPFSPDTYVYQLEHMDEAGLSIGSSGEHVNVRTFDCGLCKRKYRNKTTVRHHIRKDHNQEDPDSFITRSHFSHSDLECQFCGDVFACVEDRMDHVQNIHQTIDEDGQITGVLQQELLQEGEDHENFMPVKDVSTPEKHRYSKNQIVILKQELVPNTSKKEALSWSTSLINDIVSEQTRGDKMMMSYDCSHCSRSFTRAKALQNHLNKMHAKKLELYDCDLCGKSYKEQKQFVKHLEIAHPDVGKEKEKESVVYYECDFCDASYTSETDLVSHLDKCSVKQAAPLHPAPVQPDTVTSSTGSRDGAMTSSTRDSTVMTSRDVVSTQSVSVDDMPIMEYYTCNACGAMFSSTESLTRHMNLKHKDLSILGRKTKNKEVKKAKNDKEEGGDVVDKGDKDTDVQNNSVEYT